MNGLPITNLPSEEVQRIRDENTRELVFHLCKNARDPERIGRRLLVMEYQLQRKASSEKVIDLAKRLGVSQPRASKALADSEAALFAIKVIPTGFPEALQGKVSV